jgi:hypothetical protein
VTVGSLRLTLRLAENGSLKGKRQVIRSVIARLRNRFNVAAAEVEDNDRWQIATLGVVCVSNSARHAQEMLSEVLAFVEHERLDAEIIDSEIEVLHVL